MGNENEMTEGGLLTKGQARKLREHFGCKDPGIYQTGIVVAINETEDRFVPQSRYVDFIRRLKSIRVTVAEHYECRVIGAVHDGQHGWLVTAVTDREGPPHTQKQAVELVVANAWHIYSGDKYPIPVDEKTVTVRTTAGRVMTVKVNKYGVAIEVEGYNHAVNGDVAYLEATDGELILYAWADHDNQDYTDRIEFSPTPDEPEEPTEGDVEHIVRTLHASMYISDENLEESIGLAQAVMAWKQPGEKWARGE